MYKFISSKKGRTKNIKIISSVVTVTTLLTSGCNLFKQTNQTDISPSSTDTTVTTEFTGFIEETMPTYDPSVVYDFEWTNEDSEQFSAYVETKIGMGLIGYVNVFGYTQELNSTLTEYVNEKFSKNYEVVPFSEVNFFRSFVAFKDAGTYYYKFRDYDAFCQRYLDENSIFDGTFNNKLIISYLIQYKIPFGSRVPVENLKYFYGDDVYSVIDESYTDYMYKYRTDFCEKSEYTKQEYLYALAWYNCRINNLAFSEGIPTRSFVYYEAEDEEKVKEAIELYNDHLKIFYGTNAFQFGIIPTREQYIAIYGEEPMDLSYLNTPAKEDTPC